MSLLFLASVAVTAILLVVALRLPRPLASYVSLIAFGVLAAGVVASFISGDEGGPILLAGGVGLWWLHRWAQRDQRRLAMARFAWDHGLEFRARRSPMSREWAWRSASRRWRPAWRSRPARCSGRATL